MFVLHLLALALYGVIFERVQSLARQLCRSYDLLALLLSTQFLPFCRCDGTKFPEWTASAIYFLVQFLEQSTVHCGKDWCYYAAVVNDFSAFLSVGRGSQNVVASAVSVLIYSLSDNIPTIAVRTW